MTMTTEDVLVVAIADKDDIVEAREEGRRLGEASGIVGAQLSLVAAAISEVGRNIVQHAGEGEIEISRVVGGDSLQGVSVIARDNGPGIIDLERAMEDGYSTGDGSGFGLPGARRLMDEFELVSSYREGTTVKMCKWAQRRG